MAEITYVTGDATRPQGAGNKIIAHVCNDVGAWGKGFVLALSRRWREPEAAYRAWFGESILILGAVRLVQVHRQLYVANMIAQHGIKAVRGEPPIRYAAVNACLLDLGDKAVELGATVHMPRIGCGLAGGTWDKVEPLVRQQLCSRGIPVFVYDLPGK